MCNPVYTHWLWLRRLTFTLLGLDQLSSKAKKSELLLRLFWKCRLRLRRISHASTEGVSSLQWNVVSVLHCLVETWWGWWISGLFSSDFACLSAAASSVDCWWCSDKNNYSLCAAQLPAIHGENSATHTHTQYQRVTFCWKNEAVWGSHGSAYLWSICSCVYAWHM